MRAHVSVTAMLKSSTLANYLALSMIEREQDRAFLEWLQSNGADHPKCGLAAFPDTGRGVVALQDIGCEEVVVSVPDDAALLPDNCCIASVRTACLHSQSCLPLTVLDVTLEATMFAGA